MVTEILFFISYIIALITGILGKTFLVESVGPYLKFGFILAWALIAAKEVICIVRREYTKRTWGIAVVCVLLILIALKDNSLYGAIEFATFIPLAFAARDIDFKKIAKYTIFCELALLIVITALALGGVITNHVSGTYAIDGTLVSTRVRLYLGFLYALLPASLSFNIICMTLFYYGKDLPHWVAICLLALTAIIFVFTGSRLCFFISVAVILVVWCYTIWKRIKQTEEKDCSVITILTTAVLFFAGVFFAFIYDPQIRWMAKLNDFAEGRLELSHSGIQEFGIKLFGDNIKMIGSGINLDGVTGRYNWVDNAWMHLLFRYGIVFVLVLILLYMLFAIRMGKEKNSVACIILCFIAVQMFIDDCNLLFFWNGFLVMMLPSLSLFDGRRDKEIPDTQ